MNNGAEVGDASIVSIPRLFPSLVNGPSQVVLIAGSGLSAPYVPMLRDVCSVLENIAGSVLATTEVPPSEGAYPYALAESVIQKMVEAGNSEGESRLRLAEQLGILDDRRWFGDFGLPLSGNTPRHRVIARFAVEKRLRAIVSLNWDALLEASLESVGMTERTNAPRPWEGTTYARVVDDTHMPRLGTANVFIVVKPHGCVRELERAREQLRNGNEIGQIIFKLTSSDLDQLTSSQGRIFDTTVRPYLASCPIIGIGWSASESYLLSAVVEQAQAAQLTQQDSCTIIDIRWCENHATVAAAYGKSENESFAEVKINEHPSSDSLLLWLQARHAINRMINMVPHAEKEPLVNLLQEIELPDYSHSALSFADHWLPTWVRLCWRAGAMQGVDPQTNRLIGAFEIPITPRDSHIPLTGISVKRRDLHAASKLLIALKKSLNRFRFDLYPGGLLDVDNNHLYLPLPGWNVTAEPSDLAALKPLVEALSGLGYVSKIFLIWLDSTDQPPDKGLRNQLEAQFRRLMPLISFAHTSALSWCELSDLHGEEK